MVLYLNELPTLGWETGWYRGSVSVTLVPGVG